jgi:hypothetical protein
VCEEYTGVHVQAQGHATGVRPAPGYVIMPFGTVLISKSRSANLQLLLRFPTKLFHFLQVTKWRMRIACWIPNATNTHSEYVILIDFPLRQWLRERASMLFACVARLEMAMYSSWIRKTWNKLVRVKQCDADIYWHYVSKCCWSALQQTPKISAVWVRLRIKFTASLCVCLLYFGSAVENRHVTFVYIYIVYIYKWYMYVYICDIPIYIYMYTTYCW